MAKELKPGETLAESALRQSADVAATPHATADQAFVDAISEFNDTDGQESPPDTFIEQMGKPEGVADAELETQRPRDPAARR